MQPSISLKGKFLTVDDQSPGGGIMIIQNEGDHLLIRHGNGLTNDNYSIPMDHIEKLLER